MFAVIYLIHFSTDCRQFLRDYFIVCGHTVAKQPIYECENFLLQGKSIVTDVTFDGFFFIPNGHIQSPIFKL